MGGFAERRWRSPDGLSLYARDFPGAGGAARLPVICLHGLTRNSRDFEDVAPWLAEQGRRVLAFDIRGRGLSDHDRDPKNYQPKVYARDVAGFARSLGVGRAVFVGTSMGGIITMTLAATHSRMIAAAILNDVGPEIGQAGVQRIVSYVGKQPKVENWAHAARYVRSINEVAFPDYDDEQWERFAHRTFREAEGKPQLDYDPAIMLPLAQGRYKAPTWLAWMLFRKLARRRPTLLVRGELSDVMTADIAARMKRHAPSLRVVEVPGVGHAPMLTEPTARAGLATFLERVE